MLDITKHSKKAVIWGNEIIKIFYNVLRAKLKYLCELNRIGFVKQKESYTSKSSFWDKDSIPEYNNDNPKIYTFSGKKIHERMY